MLRRLICRRACFAARSASLGETLIVSSAATVSYSTVALSDMPQPLFNSSIAPTVFLNLRSPHSLNHSRNFSSPSSSGLFWNAHSVFCMLKKVFFFLIKKFGECFLLFGFWKFCWIVNSVLKCYSIECISLALVLNLCWPVCVNLDGSLLIHKSWSFLELLEMGSYLIPVRHVNELFRFFNYISVGWHWMNSQ